MAQIGWIDFSTEDRKKMSRAMSLIRPEGQLDELGIGRIRDGLADSLFPGISTIQTRAKYFFIVPYILRDFLYLPAREKGKTNATRYLEDREHEIKNRLRAKYKGQTRTGIIGITLKDSQHIVRLPSEIYWVGLNTFGCMQTNGLALAGFLRNLNHQNQTHTGLRKEEESDDDHDAGIDQHELQIKVPAAPPSWKEDIDIKLSGEEATFLKKSFGDATNFKLINSVLQLVFKQPALLDSINESNNFSEFARRAVAISSLPVALRKNLVLAHDFAVVIDGAHILYNHILQQHFFPDEYDDSYMELWQQWHTELPSSMIDFENFHIADLNDWLSEDSFFVSKWWEYVRKANIPNMEPLFQLIRMRETTVKGKKARLRNSKNSFSEMAPGKWIGLQSLQYRFGNAKRIIVDILNPKSNAG